MRVTYLEEKNYILAKTFSDDSYRLCHDIVFIRRKKITKLFFSARKRTFKREYYVTYNHGESIPSKKPADLD